MKWEKNPYNSFSVKKYKKFSLNAYIYISSLFSILNSPCPILIQYFWIVQYNKTKREEEGKSWLKGEEGSQRRRKGKRRKARNHLSLPTRFCVSRPTLGKRWKQNQFYGRAGIDAPPIGIDPIERSRSRSSARLEIARPPFLPVLVGEEAAYGWSTVQFAAFSCFVVPMRTDEIRSSGQLVSGKYRSIVERKERKKTRGECVFGRESLFESRFDTGSHLVSLCFKSFLLLCSIAYSYYSRFRIESRRKSWKRGNEMRFILDYDDAVLSPFWKMLGSCNNVWEKEKGTFLVSFKNGWIHIWNWRILLRIEIQLFDLKIFKFEYITLEEILVTG